MRRVKIYSKTLPGGVLLYPGTPLALTEKEQHLYHYTNRKSFGLIWGSQTLLFSKRKKMNDVMENNERLWYDSSEIDIIRCYESKVSEYGQISLAMDYDTSIKGCMSDMMWGHYGEKGKGVCIEIVTFPNVPEKVPENVTDFMKETTETLSKKLSVSVRTIKRNLKRMQELGVVTREGADHGGRWIVLSNHESVE